MNENAKDAMNLHANALARFAALAEEIEANEDPAWREAAWLSVDRAIGDIAERLALLV